MGVPLAVQLPRGRDGPLRRDEHAADCPNDVDIPRIFAIWNNKFQFDEKLEGNWDYRRVIRDGHDASKCVGCGACEGVCPQQLSIIDLLQTADAEMRAKE